MLPVPSKADILTAIRNAIGSVEGQRLTRQQFVQISGLKPSDIFRHFPSWSEALTAAGVEFEPYRQRIDEDALLKDWGELARKRRGIPTRKRYKIEGKYSPGVFEQRFGPWSSVPVKFREFAQGKPEWSDASLPLYINDLP